jgi:hypothetical protein
MSYAEAAKIAELTPQRLGQFAATDSTLVQYREEQKAKQIAKASEDYKRLPKE